MIKVNSFTLSNGLKVVHNYDSATAMVALNILYNVGSRDESPDLTGMAHLMEHLMFGGSVNVPHFDKALEAAGGTNNAWTSADFTNFYDILPAHNAETAFWLESDRMLSLAFSEKALQVQRSVVSEEFKQVCLNQPYGDMHHHLNSMVFTTHPYSHPVIGKELSHIEAVTQKDVKEFFYSHYSPTNAVLAVTGHITFKQTRQLAEKWFGDIPARLVKKRDHTPEPPQTECRRKVVTGRVPQTMIVKAYRMPGYDHPDYVACDAITDLLAAGRSSRFYRRLLMGTSYFTDVDASILGSDEPGMLMLTARLADNADLHEAEEALAHEARTLITQPPSDYELERTVNRFESNFTFGSISYVAKASAIAMSEMRGEDINSIVPRYRALTPSDIVRVSSEIFDHKAESTLIYMPE